MGFLAEAERISLIYRGAPMKVLVIGGTGNISRGIVAALQARSHEVVLFNRGQHVDAPPPDVRVIYGDRKQRADFESKVRRRRMGCCH